MFFRIVLCSDTINVSYELNPPKIVKGERFDLGQLKGNIQEMTNRASQLRGLVPAYQVLLQPDTSKSISMQKRG
jgi:hypothetical protein